MFKQLHTILVKLKYWWKQNTTDTLWVSLGENCLTDDILRRHNQKLVTTVYSHGRSNLDYALLLEERQYKGLLTKENLKYDFDGKKEVVRSLLINKCEDIFAEAHQQGFEFTHHDVIANKKDFYSISRKITRIKTLRKNKKFIFFYHHRINENTDFNLLFAKAAPFLRHYGSPQKKSIMVFFAQNIITNSSDRKVVYDKINDYTHFFNFYTHDLWEGENQDLFWARSDDDLVKIMIEKVKQISN